MGEITNLKGNSVLFWKWWKQFINYVFKVILTKRRKYVILVNILCAYIRNYIL